MIIAELNGKISSRLNDSEDLLTSNVFSFFKYANRNIYLNGFFREIGLHVHECYLASTEFKFWPRFGDGTEPDLLILSGNFYILIEAKYKSSFGEASGERDEQIIREFSEGKREASLRNKQFAYVTITSHYSKPNQLFSHLPNDIRQNIRWTNWQAVASLLLHLIEQHSNAADILFANDLYDLLVKKDLRNFRSIAEISERIPATPDPIFYSTKNSIYRDSFIGFSTAFMNAQSIAPQISTIFYLEK